MAIDITLYSGVAKKRNSTYRPQGGTAYICTLKAPSSVLNPVAIIQTDSNISGCNYAHISSFARYYFITNIVSVSNGIWEVRMKSDPLATYRTQIGNISAYVERASADYDERIIDGYYPAKNEFTYHEASVATSYHNIAPSGGTFVVGIINDIGSGQAGGAVTYYGMTPSQIRTLMAYLMSSSFIDDAGFPSVASATQQLMHDTAKAIINPMDYIVSCIWFPRANLDGSSGSVRVGYWDLGNNTFSATKLTAFTYTESGAVSIPLHPQSATRGVYLNYAPFTTLTAHIPPFGQFPIDVSYAEGITDIDIDYYIYVDVITGKGTLRLKVDGTIVYESSAMFGVPIQLAQVSTNWISAIAGVAGSASALAGMNVSGFLSGVDSSLRSLAPSVYSQGVDGSFLTEIINPVIVARYALIVDEDINDLGRPLCQTKTLNTLTGFIKCGDSHENVPGTLQEKMEIESFLANGFFME